MDSLKEHDMSNGNLPTVASEEAALIADVGACCRGTNPYCTAGCLVEIVMRKRAAMLATETTSAPSGQESLPWNELANELYAARRESARIQADYDAACRDIDELRRLNENQRDTIADRDKEIERLRDLIALERF